MPNTQSTGAAGGCQRASTKEQIKICRAHQLACLSYLEDPAADSELTRSLGKQNMSILGATRGLEDWFAEELMISHPEIFI